MRVESKVLFTVSTKGGNCLNVPSKLYLYASKIIPFAVCTPDNRLVLLENVAYPIRPIIRWVTKTKRKVHLSMC